jgi:predicted small secreted protein
MNPFSRKTSLLLLLGTFAFGLSACNTIRGLGKDTEKAGEEIQDEAKKHGAEEQPQQ